MIGVLAELERSLITERTRDGYARVSTDDQNTALQLAALQKAGCKTIFTDEGLSGATTKRPELTRCLKALRPGDTLIVWKLDRSGVTAARQRGVTFGPKPKLTPQQITHARALRAQGEPVRVIAALFKVHRATLYRVLADEAPFPFPGLPETPDFA